MADCDLAGLKFERESTTARSDSSAPTPKDKDCAALPLFFPFLARAWAGTGAAGVCDRTRRRRVPIAPRRPDRKTIGRGAALDDRHCYGFLALFARNGKQRLGRSPHRESIAPPPVTMARVAVPCCAHHHNRGDRPNPKCEEQRYITRKLSTAHSAKKGNSHLSSGHHLQYQPVVSFCEPNLTSQAAFRANAVGREIQGISLDRFGRRKKMLRSGCDIDVAGGTNARAAAFGENVVDCVALGRLHRALADFGGNFAPRSVRLDENDVRHANAHDQRNWRPPSTMRVWPVMKVA